MATFGNFIVLSTLWAASGCVGSDSYVTPAPSSEPPPKASGPVAEEPEGDEVSVVEILPADAANPARDPAREACSDGQRHYTTTPASSLSWSVKKADGSPVVGSHTVTGNLVLADGTPLAAPSLELTFNRAGAFTGQELRDERLGSAFFGVGDALRFRLESVRAADGVQALPEAGNTVELTLTGSLDVAGKTVKVEVPVLLSRRGAGLHVSDVQAPSYKIRTDWGLSAPLDAFLALAQAKIEETLTLRFALDLTETCGP